MRVWPEQGLVATTLVRDHTIVRNVCVAAATILCQWLVRALQMTLLYRFDSVLYYTALSTVSGYILRPYLRYRGLYR